MRCAGTIDCTPHGWTHPARTPGRAERNTLCEGVVRHGNVLDGASRVTELQVRA